MDSPSRVNLLFYEREIDYRRHTKVILRISALKLPGLISVLSILVRLWQQKK